MSQTITNTRTYTVTDIRKTFEGFEADLRMIARRTGKWTLDYAENVVHDILALAEEKYLQAVDITLMCNNGSAVRAARYTVNEEGKTISSERPGGNDWENFPDTYLVVITQYTTKWALLGATGQQNFQLERLWVNWGASDIDTRYSNLSKQSGQLYGSNGYELQKTNFR
ncbi:hypothetical protein [Rubrolithibacter danxiaensis]|uniref:HORMA-1 domain-containing protein n=1 Tax=Rubrolithibacter danxiaensis TaxID=3390805 RepID=UPI003BF86D8F